MSSASFVFSKILVAFLPASKFTVSVGLVNGVIITPNQSTSAKRRSFKVLLTAYIVLLNLLIFIGAANWIYNVLPSLSDDSMRQSLYDTIGQGIAVFFSVLSVVYRAYLLIIAASLSDFLFKLDHSVKFLPSKLSSFKLWVAGFVSVYFFSMAWEATYVAGVVLELTKESPWMPACGIVVFEQLVAFAGWQAAMVRFVPFAVVITTLDQLLDVLESSVKRARSVVGVASARRFGKSGMYRESICPISLEANSLEIEHLLSEFQKIQELFDHFDQLLGTLIVLLLSNSTVGFVDAISEVVQYKVKELDIPSSFTQFVTLFNHVLPLTLLNVGYLAKSRIKHMRISLKREIAAAMSRSRNEGKLMNLYRNIEDWSWEMSAAGFFTVDRSLMTGIVSAALSYIVLLLQIQGVFKPGAGNDDLLRQQLLKLLSRLNRSKLALGLEN